MTWGKLIVSHVLLHRSRFTLGKQAGALLTSLKLNEEQTFSPPQAKQATEINRITFFVVSPQMTIFPPAVPIFSAEKRLFSQHSLQELLDHKELYRNGFGVKVTEMLAFAQSGAILPFVPLKRVLAYGRYRMLPWVVFMNAC